MKTFEHNEDQIFLILLKYNFFPFSSALRNQQKILACFPEDKLSTIYPDLQIQKGLDFSEEQLSLTVQNKQGTHEHPT